MTNRDILATVLATLLLIAIAYGVGYYHGRASITCPPCTATIGELRQAEARARALADSLAQAEAIADYLRAQNEATMQSVPSTRKRLNHARREIHLEGVPAIERALMAEPHDLRAVIDSIRR
jgi:pyruvate/2-oxoglutarate dehydrogenase complex dihydrolipoamide acyltransferase (E2) component